MRVTEAIYGIVRKQLPGKMLGGNIEPRNVVEGPKMNPTPEGQNLYHGRAGLPVVFSTKNPPPPSAIIDRLVRGYWAFYKQNPESEQVAAWKSSVEALLEELTGLDAVVMSEYPIFGGAERADFLVVTGKSVLVLEAKGHRKIVEKSWLEAELDGDFSVNPCLQAASYAEKIRYFHPVGREMSVEHGVFAYNAKPDMVLLGCKIFYRGVDPRLRFRIKGGEPHPDLVRMLLNEQMTVNIDVASSLIKAAGGLDKILLAIMGREGLEGGLPLGVQAEVVRKALELYKSGSRTALVVTGEAGSGKTITALHLALAALNEGISSVYATINSRLRAYLKSLVTTVTGKVPALNYIVMPAYTRGGGVCHPRLAEASSWDLIVVDEAQRLTVNKGGPLEGCMKGSARLAAFFVDPSQVLLANEATLDDIRRMARASGRRIVELALPGPVRVPKTHLDSIRWLLDPQYQGEGKWHSPLKLRLYHKPSGYKRFRENLIRIWKQGHRTVQICAFTESRGDMKYWWTWEGPNIRIGYPLESGFDLYKGLDLKVKWLMNSKEEYTSYWAGNVEKLYLKYKRKGEKPPSPLTPLDVCASVYGAQGFDAEVVGVVWGRDLVWRNGWTANPKPITDYVGKRGSNLASLARKAQKDEKALERLVNLLKNRYYIMLTRATKELYIFFEDDDTAQVVSKFTGITLES